MKTGHDQDQDIQGSVTTTIATYNCSRLKYTYIIVTQFCRILHMTCTTVLSQSALLSTPVMTFFDLAHLSSTSKANESYTPPGLLSPFPTTNRQAQIHTHARKQDHSGKKVTLRSSSIRLAFRVA